ncbi:hypothetical protein D9599_25725 [Roseomonas sp. KE2513]|uniref:hypothetical protein n=1 Tax=Roseomonas sp. KE2513 TaxID=2479202 RepID=UPI0018DF87B2|nr:hypothetical protein [Roseomonas sp. KE2513]MBI0538957.1 hypothetical protein [Roseomonas sp. KE2513]
MANSRFDARLSKLEMTPGAGWQTWAGRPMQEWPDEALVAFIASGEDLPGGSTAASVSDEMLIQVISEAEARP